MSLPYFPLVCYHYRRSYLRSDKFGVTSVIRDPAPSPERYGSMLHFFRTFSWSLENIRRRWFRTVKECSPVYKEDRFYVLAGDGVKQPKEGRRMPGVKKLFQESENSAKPQYIHGHVFGGLGILAGNAGKWVCTPLSIRLHDKLKGVMGWKGTSVSAASHVVQMIEDAYHATCTFGDSLLLIDRYFLTVTALEKLAALNSRLSPRRISPVLLLNSRSPVNRGGDDLPKGSRCPPERTVPLL